MTTDAQQPFDETPNDDSASNSGDSPAASGAETPSELERAIAERNENYERYLRSQAELENYRKRVSRERDEDRKFAALPVIRDLLPIMDNLQRAVDAAAASHNIDDLVEGIQLALQQADGMLRGHGVEPIPAIGQPFDPHVHEALQQVPTADYDPMTVIQELERGYKLHERVVRPSKVLVAAPATAAESGAAADKASDSDN